MDENETPRRLVIPESDIRRHGPGNALGVLWRQWRAEKRLARNGIHFRDTDPAAVAAAYEAMTEAEFDAINGRQDWANWRTIPRCLSGNVVDRPLRILDLGCGTGSSTRVLAFHAPAGSHIIGYELAEPLLRFARRRSYVHRSGQAAAVEFVCQGVTETLRLPDGSAVAEKTIDVINASGVVGHHLTLQTILPLVAEIERLLSADGIAMLDVGPTLPGQDLRRLMEDVGFVYVGHHRSGWWDPTGEMVFRSPEVA